MCVHEIQILCGHSTVIDTSITILHWWFCATVKYSYDITRGAGMASETHQCYAAIHWMRLCVLRCGNHMRSARWNTIVCRPVYSRKFFNEKELIHEMQSYSAAPTSVCLFMIRICPSVCLVVTRGYSGSDRSPVYSVSIYPFYRRCAADQCTWTCGDMQLYDNSGSSKVIA